MQEIVLTKEERWQATRPNIYKNKKKYNRKNKHKDDRPRETNKDI